jgi:predicted NBD/HSP70 family sugar kinase
LAEAAHHLIESSSVPFAKIVGIGCGLAGFIAAEQGKCIDSSILNWHNVEIAVPLQTRLNLPVYVDNDANCLAIYQNLFGVGRPYSQVLSFSIGRGIGMGIIINNDLYRGASGGAGEFGHTTIITDGRLCECGKHGCLEPYISEPGIITNYLEQLNTTAYSSLERRVKQPTIDEIVALAQQGDTVAIAAFQRTGKLLGVSLANMVNIFNPECVVVSSPDTVIAAGDLLFEPMKEALKEHAFSRFSETLECIIEPLGYESWAQGAGSLVLRHFFASPEQVHMDRVAL